MRRLDGEIQRGQLLGRQQQVLQVAHEGVHICQVQGVKLRPGNALGRVAYQSPAKQNLFGQRPAKHSLNIENRQHARENFSDLFLITLPVGFEQCHMHFRQFNGRHGAASAASQFIGDVATACAAQNTTQAGRRTGANGAQALPARQAFFFDVFNGRHGLENVQQHRGVQACAHRRWYVLQHQGRTRDAGSQLRKIRRLSFGCG